MRRIARVSSGRVVMDSTRSIRFLFFISLAESDVTAARMLSEYTTNSLDECWKLLSFIPHSTPHIEGDDISKYKLG